jgi:hypothetical protein
MNISMQDNARSSPIHRPSCREGIDGFPTEAIAATQTKQSFSSYPMNTHTLQTQPAASGRHFTFHLRAAALFGAVALTAGHLSAAAVNSPAQSLSPGLDVARLFIDDMTIANTVLPMGIEGGWGRKPRVGIGNVMPEGWNHTMMWGQIYAGRPGNPALNVRVQIRDCAVWMLSRKQGIWKLLNHNVTPDGHAYREDFKDDINIRADARKEADGSVAVKLVAGYNYHFWAKDGRVAIDPADIAGMASCFFARLVVDDATKPDDRDQARIIGSCGGDYWRSMNATWKSDWSSNNDWAIGRFTLLTKEWQPITACTFGSDPFHQRYALEAKNPPPPSFERTLSAETLRKNPPPVRTLGTLE